MRYGRTAIGVLIVAVLLFPVYWMLLTSVRTEAEAVQTPPELLPTSIDLEAYDVAVLGNATVRRAIVNSVIISAGTMALTMLLAVPAAYVLARRRVRGVTPMMLVLLLTQLLPGIAVATPLFVLFKQLGLINSFAGIVLADATITVPFAILILRPFFLRIPRELEMAALVDGCRPLGAFLRVVLPVSRSGIVTVAALSFLLAWGEFLFALSLTTSEDIQPLTVSLATFAASTGTPWAQVMAVATVVAIPIVLLFIAIQRYIVGGLTLGGLKE
ncbi:MAG TPA: carbohydrate ABC transporter permease [Solirubrobacteraceae bacterium]|nr:carbohydrate ABC transporter permease [Solirubrobacteraceae bacterium]